MKKTSVLVACVSLCLSMSLALSACSQKPQDGTTEEDVAAVEEIVVEEEATIEELVENEMATVDQVVEEIQEDALGAVAEEAEEAAEGEAAEAEEKNYDNLVSWGIKVEVPDGATGVLKGTDYYIYPEKVGGMPYIILSSFTLKTDEQGFLDEFTEYMKGSHGDLTVVEGPTQVKIGDKDCWKIVYAYDIQGYAATDTRVVTMKDGRQYLFGTKDIDELSITVGDLFEQVIEAADIYGTN